ncbi:unnamed protein product, partial [Brachionus calyciflorus]
MDLQRLFSFLILSLLIDFTFCQKLDLICINSNKTNDLSVDCRVSVVTIESNPNPEILIDYGNGDSKSIFSGDSSVVVEDVNIDLDSQFLLLNTEIKVDTTLNGFGIYGKQPGLIILKLVSFNFCNSSCSNYFLQTNLESYGIYNIKETWELNITIGLEFYPIIPMKVLKGDLFVLNQSYGGQIAINSSEFLCDYLVYVKGLSFNLSRLSYNNLYKFSVKTISNETKVYFAKFKKTFQSIGTYEIAIAALNQTSKRTVTITDRISYDLFYTNSSYRHLSNVFLILSEKNLTNYDLSIEKLESKLTYKLKSDLLSFHGFNFANNESIDFWQ